MRNKKINVKEKFKSDSEEEMGKYLHEKIVKLMLCQQKLETNAV